MMEELRRHLASRGHEYDVILRFSGRDYRLPKALLSSLGPFFHAALYGSGRMMAEGNSGVLELRAEGVEVEDVEALLRWLLRLPWPGMDKELLAARAAFLSEKHLRGLALLSATYGMESLRLSLLAVIQSLFKAMEESRSLPGQLYPFLNALGALHGLDGSFEGILWEEAKQLAGRIAGGKDPAFMEALVKNHLKDPRLIQCFLAAIRA